MTYPPFRGIIDPAKAFLAIDGNFESLAIIRDQTPEICMAAVLKNRRAVGYIRDPDHYESCLQTLKFMAG